MLISISLCHCVVGDQPGGGASSGHGSGEQIRFCLPLVQNINQLLYKSFMETEEGITCVEISTDVKLKQK